MQVLIVQTGWSYWVEMMMEVSTVDRLREVRLEGFQE